MQSHRTNAGISLVLLLLFLTGLQAPAQAEEKKVFDAHATTFSYFFKDGDMDFHFGNLVLGAAVNGGAEIGEAFYAASRIKDGDAATWQKEWYDLARLVEARGLASMAAGHKVSARDPVNCVARTTGISSRVGQSTADVSFRRARVSRRGVANRLRSRGSPGSVPRVSQCLPAK
jgi:hypothetical protein